MDQPLVKNSMLLIQHVNCRRIPNLVSVFISIINTVIAIAIGVLITGNPVNQDYSLWIPFEILLTSFFGLTFVIFNVFLFDIIWLYSAPVLLVLAQGMGFVFLWNGLTKGDIDLGYIEDLEPNEDILFAIVLCVVIVPGFVAHGVAFLNQVRYWNKAEKEWKEKLLAKNLQSERELRPPPVDWQVEPLGSIESTHLKQTNVELETEGHGRSAAGTRKPRLIYSDKPPSETIVAIGSEDGYPGPNMGAAALHKDATPKDSAGQQQGHGKEQDGASAEPAEREIDLNREIAKEAAAVARARMERMSNSTLPSPNPGQENEAPASPAGNAAPQSDDREKDTYRALREKELDARKQGVGQLLKSKSQQRLYFVGKPVQATYPETAESPATVRKECMKKPAEAPLNWNQIQVESERSDKMDQSPSQGASPAAPPAGNEAKSPAQESSPVAAAVQQREAASPAGTGSEQAKSPAAAPGSDATKTPVQGVSPAAAAPSPAGSKRNDPDAGSSGVSPIAQALQVSEPPPAAAVDPGAPSPKQVSSPVPMIRQDGHHPTVSPHSSPATSTSTKATPIAVPAETPPSAPTEKAKEAVAGPAKLNADNSQDLPVEVTQQSPLNSPSN